MVSYYNSLNYSQRHATNLSYPPAQHWFPSNYHPPSNHQFLNDIDSSHQQHVYYSPHHMLHQSNIDWHSTHDHYTSSQTQITQQHQQQHPSQNTANQLNDSGSVGESLTEGLPSPPITVSGSEISSPGAPHASSSPQGVGGNRNAQNRSPHVKSPFYDWMKKPAYSTQPIPGKTRTKDKYRVVYTDYQRLELEKEYHTSKYITIRRKTELAQTLQLSERQVKIWFQNRRAKERKQNKKREDPLTTSHNNDLANLIETKTKIESGLQLQHPLHQMSSMTMGISPMSLHHPVLHHGHLAIPPPPPPQHLHQTHQQVTGTVGALTI